MIALKLGNLVLAFTNALKIRMATGAGIGLLIIGFFVIDAGEGNPSWGNYWQIKPLLLTPFCGALLGMCFGITESLRRLTGGWGKLFLILSIFGIIVGLWISVILGLAGTMWN